MDNKDCAVCINVMDENERNADELPKYHQECIKCKSCNAPLGKKQWCFVYKQETYCDVTCLRYKRKPDDSRCAKCRKLLHGLANVYKLCGRVFHKECLRCSICNKKFKTGQRFEVEDNEIICASHTDSNKKKDVIRTKISEAQRLRLCIYYVKNKYPNRFMLEKIANNIKLPVQVVKVWFQNKRARRVDDLEES